MEDWVDEELSTASFGDRRLKARCKTLIQSLMESPKDSIAASCKGYAETMGAYRFIENPNVRFNNILDPHKEATRGRISREETILVAQDTTSLDYTGKRGSPDLGHIESASRRGIFLHLSLAIAIDGLVLGAIGAEVWSRDINAIGKTESRKELPIEEKESNRWLKSIENTERVWEEYPGKLIINIADRECDIHECLEKAVEIKDKVKVVIRCGQNRRTISENQEIIKIYEAAEKLPFLGTSLVKVKQNNRYRNAAINVKAGKIKIKAPYRKGKKQKDQKDVEINLVHAKEENPPQGYEAIEWLIITTLEVNTLEEAVFVLEVYACRWNIEIFFRILKQACQIEELQLETKQRLMVVLALYMIIAWREMFLMTLGRTCPEIAADTVFDDMEWKAIYIIDTGQPPPEKAPSLGVILIMIAKQGGYINRNNDPRPGPKALWIGLRKLCDFVLMYEKLEKLKTCV